jgi:RND family efflux transporter MFP subunit
MIAFITLIYCGLIWLLFFKLKVLPFNAAAKVIVSVVGVAGILALLIFMTMYQPYSKDLTVYQNIVQVAPEVGGRVVEVPVKALAPVKRGDILFKIDPRPYQYQVDKLTASLEVARSDLELATIELERAEDILKKGAGSSRDVNKWRVKVAGAEGSVGKLEAELDDANYDLEQTTVYAPADGFVADLQLLEGSMAQARVPVIAFVDTSSSYAIAVLGQNAIRYIRAGNPAEVALILKPGEIFNASVEEVVQASAQQTATGLISAQPDSSLPMGTMAVRLKFDSAVQPAQLPSGANGAVAIYTDSGKPLRIIRKVVIRMFTWLNFMP